MIVAQLGRPKCGVRE